jgi:hypothetical protein
VLDFISAVIRGLAALNRDHASFIS